MQEIAPSELAARLRTDPLVLLDVREPWEFALCHIDGALPMPLAELSSRVAELEREAAIVAICHHGMRSHYAAEYLLTQGFTNVSNLLGGIHRWAAEIDPTMPQY